jgi:large subunit ribosomal protein L24
MRKFSISWKSSRKPGKQRKYRTGAPIHIKQKLVKVHLARDIRKKYGKRSIGVRKGDKVKVFIGQFRKHEGKVERVNVKNTKVYITGVEFPKRDGTKRQYGINPSNLMITELNMEDKMRQKALARIERK